ncbi:hypothetical protein CEP54_011913 [Fusarium duplospermum]|uniref:Uncharacterized protein n=1 Tax=Fusarium duplospermum TaxID=1325734 RepID=A0A428PBN8_9HYPO|nr:hypothetical protein CEP54_011913 [Fusarium duplospermum]
MVMWSPQGASWTKHCAPSSSPASLIPLTLGLPSCRFPFVYDSGELTLVELCRIYELAIGVRTALLSIIRPPT